VSKCAQICTSCAKVTPFALKGKCECGGTLLVHYDLERVRHTMTREALSTRPTTMWRYHELLPVMDLRSVISLGEGWTPLIRVPSLEKRYNLKEILIKREEQNPTGSFKSRGFSVAVSLLAERNIQKAAVPSNGNAASALAAYAAHAGIDATVIVPQDCPEYIVRECVHYGASTYIIDGMIHDAGNIIDDGTEEQGWFNVGTMREPGRAEGKKTMGLELAEQLGWSTPDVIIYPTGGGSGIVGLWKAFKELKELGLISGEMPRLVSVQEEGCHPIVTAVRTNQPVQEAEPSDEVSPTGMRVPYPPDGQLIARMIQETGGTAVAVTKQEIEAAQLEMGGYGISASPEGAATLAGLHKVAADSWLRSTDRVVLFNTSHAMKYVDWAKPFPNVPLVRSYKDVNGSVKK
jgi:threonine synthase